VPFISPWIPLDSGYFGVSEVVAASGHLKLLYFFGGLVWPPSKLLFVSSAFLFEDGVCPSFLLWRFGLAPLQIVFYFLELFV